MSTFRDTVTWVIALLGAVAVYDAFGPVWLAAWTVGVMAFVHSRNWSGTFPGDEAFDAQEEAQLPALEREAPERGGQHHHDRHAARDLRAPEQPTRERDCGYRAA